jgi:hypothetical protein
MTLIGLIIDVLPEASSIYPVSSLVIGSSNAIIIVYSGASYLSGVIGMSGVAVTL